MSDNITTASGSAQLVFVEAPPVATRGRGSDSTAWVAEAQTLKLNPEKWAILASFTVAKKAAALAATVNGGKVRAFAPKGEFQAVSRTVDGNGIVYARYVGPNFVES